MSLTVRAGANRCSLVCARGERDERRGRRRSGAAPSTPSASRSARDSRRVPRGARAVAPTGRTCGSPARCSPCSRDAVLPPQRALPERVLRPDRAHAARQRRQHQLRAGRLSSFHPHCSRRSAPRVMATAAAPPDADGWCSLSLHAGATVDRTAPRRRRPRPAARRRGERTGTRGPRAAPEHRHALHVDEIDVLLESDREPFTIDDPPPTDVERAIAEHVPRVRAGRRDPADRHRRGPVDGRRAARRRATAATTASTRRCSPPASCACTRRARSRTARASTTACRWPPSPPAPASSTTGSTATPTSPSCRSTS